MECKVHMGAWKVCGRCAKGAWRCVEGEQREHGGAQKGVQVGPEPGQSGRVGRGWWLYAACRERQKSRKFSKIFQKCACFERAYHENLTWRGLMGVAEGQEVCGGSAS